MCRRLFHGKTLLLASLILSGWPASLLGADKWSLPATDAEKWTARIRKILPERGWTVTIRGNDIVVQREKPVRFVEDPLPSGPTGGPFLSDGDYRITLRFAPKMSYEEFERLDAENAAMYEKQKELQKSVGDIPHKFDDYLPRTPEEEQRVKKYREAAAKFVRHTLPDLYTPDFSIHVFQSWRGFAKVADKEVARECGGVCHDLLQYFGTYLSPRRVLRVQTCWRWGPPQPTPLTPPPAGKPFPR